ncbi:MAG: DUF3137 domain-containing protein [Alteraurantiacibacter sp.]
MIARPDIDALMAGELGLWLQQQAVVREEARAVSNGRLVKSAVVVLPLAAFLLFGPDWSGQLKMWLIGLACAGAGFWIYAPRGAAIKQTKEGINAALAAALGLSYANETGPSLGFGRAKTFRMVPNYDRESFEDLWSGEVGDRAFALHEANLQQRRQSGKTTTYVTVFRGPIMTIACDRQFHGTTLVERSGKHKRFGLFGEKDEVELGDHNLAKVDMVHPGFEDEFTIYSTDQVEARYLVHPVYVEKLVALEAAFAGQKIRTLFHEGELTVVLETADMFESGGMDATRDRWMVKQCVGQFMAMVELAGTLNEPGR